MNRQVRFTIASLLLCLSLVRAAESAAIDTAALTAKERRQGYRDGVIIAKPRSTQRIAADTAESREGLRLRRRWDRFGGMRLLQLPQGESAPEAVARLRASGRYEFVQLDTIRYAHTTPNDPDFTRQWPHLNSGANNGVANVDIKSTAAWDIRNDASNIIVAVIDSGVRYDHPDLAANMWANPREIPGNGRDDDGNGYLDDVHGINAIVNRSSPAAGDPRDDLGHGTHVAGIIGAVGDNGIGIAGVAWRVKLMALKFLRGENSATGANPAGEGTTSDAIECIDYAIANGAHIINASYGAAGGQTLLFDPAEYEAIRRARDAGIIFVAAAGNEGVDIDLRAHFPASFRLENVVTVANSTNRDDLYGTNFGAGSVDLFAPGTEIYSTWYAPGTPYLLQTGTSMAAPHVAGAFALMKAQFPNDSYRQLINRVLRSADPVSALSGRVQTGGRLNLDRALRSTDNRPFNDDFATRARLRGSNVAVRTVNTGATIESEPALAGQAPGATLWWEWTPTVNGTVRLSTDGSSYDTVVGVFTGTNLGGLVAIASNDDDSGKITSRVEFSAQAGTSYQIAVGGKGGAHGLTLLDLGAIPANDNFAGAQLITGRSALVSAVNAQATLEAGEARIRGFNGGKSLWYRWTAPGTDRFQFAAKSDGFDPLLAIYTGTSLADLTLVGSSDNADREAGGASAHTSAVVTVNASVGVTYFIQVDGKATNLLPPANSPFVLLLNDSLWQGVTGGSVTNAPTVGPDGSVYVGSTDGWFHAFNADGRRRWPALNFEGAQDTSAAALAADGTLYIGVGATNAAGNNAKLYAYNSGTGVKKWEIVVGAGASANNAIALAADGTIYLHSDEGRLFAFADTGTAAVQKWSTAIPGNSYASVTIAPDGTLYLGCDDVIGSNHRMFAINPGDGTLKWSFRADNPIYTTATLDAEGNIYFATLGSGRLYSLTSAGTVRWTYAGVQDSASSSPSLSPDGRTVYFAGYDGRLHAVDTATGTSRWTFRMGTEVRASSPAIDANGVIYIGCYDNLLYAINPNGTLNRTWATGDIIRSSPALAGATLYVGSNDNGIYAFDIAAPAAGPWPQYRHNARRTGRVITDPPSVALAPRPQAAVSGSLVELTVSATGTGPFAYQWFKDGQIVSGATTATLALPAISAASAGNYAVSITSPSGSVTTSPAAVTVRGAGDPLLSPRLINLSVRTTAGIGDQTLIVGFFMSGGPAKPVLIRGIGPTLASFGVTGTLTDPRLQLLSGTTIVSENDDWFTSPAVAETSAAVGAFPLPNGTRDAALVRSVTSGGYTVQITGTSGSGIALAELYDTSPAEGARLTNLSARSQVTTGGDVLIAGFSVSGNAPKTILIRGVGPTLGTLGVGGALADPRLTLFQGAAKLDENNDWAGAATLVNIFARVGAFALPPTSRDAALLVSLTPGSYTAQVSGVNDTTGVALVEVYEVDAP